MKPTLKEIDTDKRVALFENDARIFSVEYDLYPNGHCYISACESCDINLNDIEAYITKSIDAYLLSERSLKQYCNDLKNDNGKQPRYTDDSGKDLIDEWAEIYPIETFRVLMWEQMRKYHRRLGKKDDAVLEVGKIADYARRWAMVEANRS